MNIHINRTAIVLAVLMLHTLRIFGTNNDNKIQPSFLSADSHWADSVFNSLTDEQRIAQLLMAAVYPNKDSVHYKQMYELISKYNIGGVIVFQGGPVKTALYLNQLQSKAQTPMIAGIDGEWGLAMRMDSTIVYPKQIMLGAISDDNLIYQMGVDIAQQLHRMGLHTNFSPVADVNNNPSNPVINTRSFGESRQLVLAKSFAYMAGLQDNKILATAKHFPGHGDTETDSHLDLPILPYNSARLDSIELYPFRELINSGISSVMVAHLSVPSLDPSGVPSTLSNRIIDSLLIKNMGFQGLIFTDAMNMKGVSKKYAKTMAIDAFRAGNDIFLMPEDVKAFIESLKTAVKNGTISQNEVNRRCKKILLAKYWLGLNKYRPIDTTNLLVDLHKPEYYLNLRRLIEAGLTLVKNEKNLIPFIHADTARIACVSVGTGDTTIFQKYCSLYYPMDFYSIDKNASDSVHNELLTRLKKYNLIIAGLLNTDMRYVKRFGINDVSVDFLQRLADSNNVALNVFANPYSLQRFSNISKFKSVVVAYEDKPLNQELTAQFLFGAIKIHGKLPVKATDSLSFGTGIKIEKTIRLKYTIPEELGIDHYTLLSIDSIVNDAIKKHALPGCQVLVAKEGKVFFNKSYGYFTYDSTRIVQNSDIYDIASITKMAATTSAMMKLYDDDKVNLNKPLKAYIHEAHGTKKNKLVIKEIMTHQAGFKPFIPFQLKTLECIDPFQILVSKKAMPNSVKAGDNMYINCESKYKSGIFQRYPSSDYPYQVSDSLFIHKSWHDTIYNTIYSSELTQNPQYKYSDLGFILLRQVVEKESSKKFDVFLDSFLYKPLGANNTCFLPLNRFSKEKIAPTENDLVFRKQLIQGYVHDPVAAMLGGVSGHAGLFSNANDMAKLMQLFLNKGEYGGHRYFKSETIELFTSRAFPNGTNRRGIGFDKPEPDTTKDSPVSRYCSYSSFGHTGFTGTMVWADPAKQLVFVFLSNRVYPDASVNRLAILNVRTQIQDILYKAILNSKENEKEKTLILEAKTK